MAKASKHQYLISPQVLEEFVGSMRYPISLSDIGGVSNFDAAELTRQYDEVVKLCKQEVKLRLEPLIRQQKHYATGSVATVVHVGAKESAEAQITALQKTQARLRQSQQEREEREKLRVENQLLQSRVAEARRTAARETQRYDQLLIEFNRLQAQNDNLLTCVNERTQAADATTSLLLEKKNAQLRMFELYEGVVEHVFRDSFTVVFETDDNDIVEHKYSKTQMLDKQLPEESDRFTVYVHVTHSSVVTDDDTSVDSEETDEQVDDRRKITGPTEF